MRITPLQDQDLSVHAHSLPQFRPHLIGISQYYRPIPEIDEWRRRIRMCYWKQWRWARTRIRNLLALGVRLKAAIQQGINSNSYWRMARTPVT